MNDQEKIIKSLALLIKNDFYLLSIEANERSLTHRLALYLEAFYPEYNVDCEYNRSGVDKKVLCSIKDNMNSMVNIDDLDGNTVFPDIIIHKRGTADNYLVIEAKKSKGNKENFNIDIKKLQAYMTGTLSYKHAFFIKLPVGSDLTNYKQETISEFVKKVR